MTFPVNKMSENVMYFFISENYNKKGIIIYKFEQNIRLSLNIQYEADDRST